MTFYFDRIGRGAPVLVSWTWGDGKQLRFDQENTGYGWKTEQKIDAWVAAQPTSCQMKRPH